MPKRYVPAWRDRLHEAFPQAILERGQPKRPLKIGIYRDIKARLPDMPAQAIHRALNDYVSGPTYLSNCVVGAERIDLDGSPAGTVDERGEAFAQGHLRGLQKLWAFKRRQRDRINIRRARRKVSP